jgi:hypothetical protein
MTGATVSAACLEELETAIDQYLRDYPPAGYATKIVTKPRFREDLGLWEAELSRYSSCE